MTRTAMSGSALGTGSELYNGIATHALATSLFGKMDAPLTNRIVDQLKTEIPGAAWKTAHHPAVVTLAAMPQVQDTTKPDPSLLDRAVSYAKSVWPAIRAGAASLDVPPVALLAQSALETGWGASAPGNNLFGIKAVAGQTANVEPTYEEIGGVIQASRAAFAAYRSADASVSRYVNLIRGFYQNAIGSTSVAQYANALAQRGYATDADYPKKIVDIAQSPIMQSVLHAIEGAAP